MKLIIVTLLFSTTIQCSDAQLDSLHLRSLDDVPAYFSSLIASSNEASDGIFPVLEQEAAVLDLLTWNNHDVPPFSTINVYARKKSYQLRNVSPGENIDFIALYTTLLLTVIDIKSGWVFGTSKDAKRTYFKRDLDDWHLLIKRKRLNGEDMLITNFASLLHIKHHIICDDYFLDMNEEDDSKNIYLWISKHSYQKVMNAFKLSVVEPIQLSPRRHEHETEIRRRVSGMLSWPGRYH